MRQIMKSQLIFGQPSIENMKINLRCRDDIPALLLGLKELYLNQDLRTKVLERFESDISKEISLQHGRPGMDLWRILVLGVVKLGAALDYDRLHDLANEHASLRVLLMTDDSNGNAEYWTFETIQDNVRLLTPEILDEINTFVVQFGHSIKKNEGEDVNTIKTRCDSFVVETDVHFPTDISLLFDAIRKILKIMSLLDPIESSGAWRQWKHLLKKIKKIIRAIGRLRHSIRNSKKGRGTSKQTNEKKTQRQEILQLESNILHQELIELCRQIVDRAEKDLANFPEKMSAAGYFIAHAKRQIDQIDRRVLKGESIPQSEKVFSIFEPHTEWISKGKAGVPQELGVRVSIVEDQYGFILNHTIMHKQVDNQVAIPLMKDTKVRFPNLDSCSFDKGYHSPENKLELEKILNVVILPKKGKLNASQFEEENSDSFIKSRNQHSAVESAINSLEHHGLDRCRDVGIDGFKRYVSLAILGKNLYHLGVILRKRDRTRLAQSAADQAA